MNYQNENFNGEYDFRSNFHDGWTVSSNLHEYSEILYCKKGEGIATVNGQPIAVKEKQLIWIPPNYVHCYNFENAEVVCAVFSNDLIPLFFKALEGKYFCVSPIDAGELSPALEKLYLLKKDDSMMVSGYLNLVCSLVFKQSKLEIGKHSDGVLYQKVISYVSSNYTEDITLSSVAKRFGYNEKYLSHTLHELTGIHFRQLLTFYRINHAKKLLESRTDKNITVIAEESGFFSTKTFNRSFKENTGMTPIEYRRKYAK
jgi:AraC-like DNA-binding protein